MNQRRNVTIMSSDSALREALNDALSRQEMDCEDFEDVMALKERLQTGQPTDLVILDLDEDFGLVGDKIQHHLQDCTLTSPVIGISGSNSIPREARLMLDGLLLKPFEMTELLTLVNQLTTVLELKHFCNRTETQPIWN